MSRWSEDTNERNYLTAWIVWGFIVVVGLVLAWVFLVNPLLVDKQGDTFRDSYGSEQARIDAARQAVVAIQASNDDGQIKALTNQACALIADTGEVPPDLAAFATDNC